MVEKNPLVKRYITSGNEMDHKTWIATLAAELADKKRKTSFLGPLGEKQLRLFE